MASFVTAEKVKFDFVKTVQDITSVVELEQINLESVHDSIVTIFDIAKILHLKIGVNTEKVYEFCRLTTKKLSVELQPIYHDCNNITNGVGHTEASSLKQFFVYFLQNAKTMSKLPNDIRFYELEKPDGILQMLCNATQLNGVLFKNMHQLLNYQTVIQSGEYETVIFHGIQIHMLIMLFLIEQFAFLAKIHYQRGNLCKYVECFNSILLNFEQLKRQLVHDGGFITLCQIHGTLPSLTEILNGYKQTISELHFPLTFDDDKILNVNSLHYNKPNSLYVVEIEKDQNLLTPLHLAVFAGRTMIVAVLNQSNIDINAQSVAGLTALHIAAMSNAVDATKALLERETINVNAKSVGNYTALHLATIQGHFEIVKILLASTEIDVNAQAIGGWTALHIAHALKHEQIAEELLKVASLNVNAKIFDDLTALHIAARVDGEKSLKMLHENNADFKIKTKAGLTAQQIAEKFNCANALQMFEQHAREENNDDDDDEDEETTINSNFTDFESANIVQYLIKYHVKINLKNELNNILLEKTVKAELFDATKFLFKHKFLSINKRGKEIGLLTAAQAGDLNVVEFLLKEDVNIEASDDNGMTTLCQATLKGHLEIIKLLVAHGASISAINKNDKSVLHLAIMSGNFAVFQYFLETQKFDDAFDENLLCFAAQFGPLDVVKYLIEMKGLNPQLQNKRKENSVSPICAAIIGGHFETIKYLIEDQAIDISNNNVPLHFAIESNKLDIIKYLLDKGANLHAKSTVGDSAILYAAQKSNLQVFQLLLERGADIKDQGPFGSVLRYAAEAVNLEIIKFLVDEKQFKLNNNIYRISPFLHAAAIGTLEAVKYYVDEKQFNVFEQNEFKETVLHYASKNKNLSIVRYFVEVHNLDIKARDKLGRTPLFTAAENNNLDVVKYFVADQKLGIHLKDKENRSILHIAALNGHLDIVRYLIEEHGANINFKDNKGKKPLQLSIETQKLNVVKYLFSQESSTNENSNLLHCAVKYASYGSLEIIKYFVEEKGFDINMKDMQGRTPLFYAYAEDKTVLEYLSAKGAKL